MGLVLTIYTCSPENHFEANFLHMCYQLLSPDTETLKNHTKETTKTHACLPSNIRVMISPLPGFWRQILVWNCTKTQQYKKKRILIAFIFTIKLLTIAQTNSENFPGNFFSKMQHCNIHPLKLLGDKTLKTMYSFYCDTTPLATYFLISFRGIK